MEASTTVVTDYDWSTLDSSEAAETVVLLGAGASADAGRPTSTELHHRLSDRLGPLYNNLAGLVFREGEAPDVERLFRVIQFVHAVETEQRDADRRITHEGIDLARLVDRWVPSLQQYLDEKRHTTQGSETGSLIDQLWEALLDLLWWVPTAQSENQHLAWLLRSMKGGTIATLNYDNSLEIAKGYATTLALDPEPWPIDRTVPLPGVAGKYDTVRILKLHGSLNWEVTLDPGGVRVLTDEEMVNRRLVSQISGIRPLAPGVIFGAGNKLRPDGPYLDLLSEFKVALDAARRLIVIGYSFRDEHINEMLRRWLARHDRRRLLRIGRRSDGGVPYVVRQWAPHNDAVEIQVVAGRLVDTVVDLMRSTPDLAR